MQTKKKKNKNGLALNYRLRTLSAGVMLSKEHLVWSLRMF